MVELTRMDAAVILRFTEVQLQMYVIPQMKTAVMKILDEKPRHVIFDMQNVEHIDSSAMGAIFHFQRKIHEYNGKLGLVHVSSKVMQVFKITKSDNHFDVFDSIEAAIKAK